MERLPVHMSVCPTLIYRLSINFPYKIVASASVEADELILKPTLTEPEETKATLAASTWRTHFLKAYPVVTVMEVESPCVTSWAESGFCGFLCGFPFTAVRH